MGLFKSDAPAAPDYSGLIAQSNANASHANDLADKQFAWAQDTYNQNKGVTDQINANMIQAQNDQLKNSEADRSRYESEFQPQEDALVNDANTYAGADNMDRMRGRAESSVSQAGEAQRQASMRDLESYGINPGAVRYAGLDTGIRSQQAAAQAAAGSQSDLATEATGRALRSEAINVGRGYPGQSVGETGASVGAGGAAAGSTLATTASGANTMGTAPTWSGLANSATNTSVNAMNTSYNNQMQNYNANNQGWQALGGIAGTIGGAAVGGYMRGPSGQAMFAAGGGEVPDNLGDGAQGAVPVNASPSRGQAIDDVDAKLSPGEFVVPKDAVAWLGEKHFQNLIQKARQDKQGAQAKPQVRQAIPGPATYHSPGSSRSAIPMTA